MKCPKCGYLGFESGDRCRNCGYDFSLSSPARPIRSTSALDLRPGRSRGPPLDLDRIIGAPDPAAAADLPLFAPSAAEITNRPSRSRRGVRGLRSATPTTRRLIDVPSRPARRSV